MKWLLAKFCDFLLLLLLLLLILFKVDNSNGLYYRDLTRQQRGNADRGQHS